MERFQRELASPPPWQIAEGAGALLATAIHNGHYVPSEQLAGMALSPFARLREEDPSTGEWTAIVPTQVVVNLSRFWVDLNRPRNKAAYLNPEDAWGLNIWQEKQDADTVALRLASHDRFYREMYELLAKKKQEHGCFVIFDFHSYNHQRVGPDAPFDDPTLNPDINVGTGTMTDRQAWAGVVDGFIKDMQAFDFHGRTLDVRENVKFKGGYFPEWVHKNFPDSGCVISVEVKKFFMNEWSGEVDHKKLDLIGKALSATVPGIAAGLEKVATRFNRNSMASS